MQSAKDEDGTVSFERHVRAADYGINMAWRWAGILAAIIMIGVQIGGYFANARAQELATADIKGSVADVRRDIAELRKSNTDLALQTDRNTRDIGELKDLKNEIRELRSQVDTLRNMREAYVYDSAKAARNKLLQQATTPP